VLRVWILSSSTRVRSERGCSRRVWALRSAWGERLALATGSAWARVLVFEQRLGRGFFEVLGEAVDEHAEEHMCFEAVGEAVGDRADPEEPVPDRLELPLDFLDVLVGANHLGARERFHRNAGAQDGEAVERRFLIDLLGLARVGQAGVGDLDVDVLLDPVALERSARPPARSAPGRSGCLPGFAA